MTTYRRAPTHSHPNSPSARRPWWRAGVVATITVILTLGLPVLAGTTAANAAPCYTHNLPCPPPPRPNYTFPGMVLPVRAGGTIPGGEEYTGSFDDAKCVATLTAFGVTVAYTGGTELLIVPVAIEVTNVLAEACAGTVLTAVGAIPPE